MAALALSLETLGHISNGAAQELIDKAIGGAISDLDDRGDDDLKARKVEITITLQPIEGGNVSIDVEAIAKVPKYRTPPTFAKVRSVRGGEQKLMFQEYATDNPDQKTIDDANDE